MPRCNNSSCRAFERNGEWVVDNDCDTNCNCPLDELGGKIAPVGDELFTPCCSVVTSLPDLMEKLRDCVTISIPQGEAVYRCSWERGGKIIIDLHRDYEDRIVRIVRV